VDRQVKQPVCDVLQLQFPEFFEEVIQSLVTQLKACLNADFAHAQ
jgi:hypothetical protein